MFRSLILISSFINLMMFYDWFSSQLQRRFHSITSRTPSRNNRINLRQRYFQFHKLLWMNSQLMEWLLRTADCLSDAGEAKRRLWYRAHASPCFMNDEKEFNEANGEWVSTGCTYLHDWDTKTAMRLVAGRAQKDAELGRATDTERQGRSS